MQKVHFSWSTLTRLHFFSQLTVDAVNACQPPFYSPFHLTQNMQQSTIQKLNHRLVWYSDPHCIAWSIKFLPKTQVYHNYIFFSLEINNNDLQSNGTGQEERSGISEGKLLYKIMCLFYAANIVKKIYQLNI